MAVVSDELRIIKLNSSNYLSLNEAHFMVRITRQLDRTYDYAFR